MCRDQSLSGRMMIKRGIDIIGAGIGLVATAPLLAVAAIAVRTTMGSPILFRQGRPGRLGAVFTLCKLRTMAPERDAAGVVLPDFARVTALGRFLRKTSLDELPQLWNVVKGDMSLVGPRPLLTQYLDRYDAEQARRHQVKPGITGWAQIHRRSATSWGDRLRLDVWYVDHWSLWLDCRILAATIVEIFTSRGAPSMDSLSRTTDNELEFRASAGPAVSAGEALPPS